MPLIDLPVRLQSDNFSCGAAVFRCVTAYWEGRGRRMKSHPHYGTHPDVLELAFHAAGYHVLAGGMDLEQLKFTTGRGWPVVCLVKADGEGHWVAVRGVRRNRVYLMDPSDGLTDVSAADWLAGWSDYDRRGTVFRQYGLAVWY
jgi:predicted double-glycine peptidase